VDASSGRPGVIVIIAMIILPLLLLSHDREDDDGMEPFPIVVVDV